MDEKIIIVDAFTDQPFGGNPAGVVLLNEKKPDGYMLSLAKEINLSETAYVLKTGNSYSLRWFTPAVEVDLCGHATLAAAFVLYQTGVFPYDRKISFESKSGFLGAQEKDGFIWLSFPKFGFSPVEIKDEHNRSINTKPVSLFRTGPNLMAVLGNVQDVIDTVPDLKKISQLDVQGLIVTACSEEPGIDFVSRYFAPKIGINEDPVTGSSHCSLAPYWASILGKTEMDAKQVSERGGYLRVIAGKETVEIGGKAKIIYSGVLAV